MAQLISATTKLEQHQLVLLFMDCFGKRQIVYLSLTAGPSVADKTASTLAEMTTAESTIKAACIANNIDITQALADGATAIAEALAGK